MKVYDSRDVHRRYLPGRMPRRQERCPAGRRSPLSALVGQLSLAGALGAPAAGALVVAARGARGLRAAAGLGWLSAILAAVAAGAVALDGPFVVAARSDGQVLVGLWANQLTVTLAVLVCVVGAVVQS